MYAITVPEYIKRMQEKLEAEKKAKGEYPGVLGEIYRNVVSALEVIPIEQRREVALNVLIASATIGAIASFLDKGSDFLDFGIGNLMSSALNPLVSRMIGQPLDDWLEDIQRFDSLKPTMFLRRGVAEYMTPEMIIDSLVDSGFKDKEIQKTVIMTSLMRVSEAWRDWADADRIQEAREIEELRLVTKDLDSEISRLKTEIKDIEMDELTVLIKQNMKLVDEEISALRKEISALTKVRAKK